MMTRAQPQIAACPLATPRVIALLPPPFAQGCDPLQGAISRPSTRVIAACAASIAEQQQEQQEVVELPGWQERMIRRKVNRGQHGSLPIQQQAVQQQAGNDNEYEDIFQGVEQTTAVNVSTAAQLEARLRSFSNVRDLMQFVLEEYKKPLKPDELVFICNQLSKLCEPKTMPSKAWQETKLFLDVQFARYPNFLEQLTAYEMLVVITALGKAKYEPKPEWLEHYFALSMEHLPTYGPGYIYLLLRAVEQTGLQLWQLKRISGFKEWMHAVLGVALAKVRAYRADELVRTLGVLSDLRWRPSVEFQAEFGDALKQKLEYLAPPQLSAALHALESTYIRPDEELTQALMRQLQWKLPMFDDRDLATTAQAMKLIKRVNPALISDFMVDVAQKVSTFSPMALANLLGAFADLVLEGKMAICPYQLQGTAVPVTVAPQNRSSPAPRTPAAGLPSSSEQREQGSSNQGGAVQTTHVVDDKQSRTSRQDSMQEEFGSTNTDDDQPEANNASNGTQRLKPPLHRPKLFQQQPLPEMDEQARQQLDALRPLSPEVVAAYKRASPAYGNLLPTVGARGKPAMGPAESRLPAASPAWLQLMETAVTARLPDMALHQAAMSLRGLAVMGHQMNTATLADFFKTSQPFLKTARALTLLHLLQALAFGQYRPADREQEELFTSWHAELCRTLTRRVFSQDQVCDLISALAALPVRPTDYQLTSILTHTRRNRPSALKHSSPRRLALLLTGLKRLNHKPEFGFIHAFAQGIKFHWAAIEPQDFAAIMSALPVLGPAPLAFDQLWMAEMLAMVQCQIEKFDGPNLAVLLAAVVVLGCDPARKGPTGAGLPSARWCELVFQRLEEQQHMLAAPHAASVLWAAARLQQPPGVSSPASRSLPGRTPSSSQLSTQAVTAMTAEKPTLNPAFLELLISRVATAPNSLNAGQLADVMWSLDVLDRPIPPPLLQAHATLQLAVQASQQEHAHVQGKLPMSLATHDRPQSHALDADDVHLDETGSDHAFVPMLSSTSQRNLLLTDRSRVWRASDRYDITEGGDNTLSGGMREQRVGVPV